MYYVRAYVRMHLCVCVSRQSPVHLSVCRYECSHTFCMRAGIHASVGLFACACVRASVCVCMVMSVGYMPAYMCVYLNVRDFFLHLTSYF